MSVPRIRIDFGSGLQEEALPANWKQIKFEALFTNQFPSSSLQSILFEWRGETAQKIINYFNQGLTGGGQGVTEGIPLEISIGDPLVVFNVIIDIGNSAMEMEREIVKAPIKRVGSIDWLSDTLQGITYTLLDDLGYFSPPVGDPGYNPSAQYFYKKVPYDVTIPTDIPQALMLLLEEVTMVYSIKKQTTDTINAFAKLPADIAAIAVFGVGAIYGVVDLIAALLDLAFEILLIIAIIGNVESLLSQSGLFPKYKYAMTVRDLTNAAFEYINSLGTTMPINFQSTIITDPNSPYYNLTIMPRKGLKESSSLTKALLMGGKLHRGTEVGVPNTYGYYDYDAKKLFDQLNLVFNAKGTLIGNTFNWEEVHHFNNFAPFFLPNVDKPGYNFNWPAPSGHNWSDLSLYYRIAFAIDPMEERTSIVYTGTSCAVTLQQKIVKNALNLLVPPSKEITFPFALAKRKEHLNVIQNIINDILNGIALVYNGFAALYNEVVSGVNFLSNIFGASNPLDPLPAMPINILNALLGSMEVSGDQWQEQKLFIGVDVGGLWQIDPNNGMNNNGIFNNPNSTDSNYLGEGYMSAYAIMQQFHGYNLAVFNPVDKFGNNLSPINNQWLTYRGKRFPMASKDFNTILNNNVLITADNKIGKFEKLLWHLDEDEAQEVDYRINQKYNDNLIQSISIDGN